jgi:hypothetical protein
MDFRSATISCKKGLDNIDPREIANKLFIYEDI